MSVVLLWTLSVPDECCSTLALSVLDECCSTLDFECT
jgi:hypothetical protein